MNQEYCVIFLEEPVMVIVYDNILRLRRSCNKFVKLMLKLNGCYL